MLDLDGANVPASIEIKDRVLVQVTLLSDRRVPELNQHRVGVLELADLHGSKLRPKYALCTASPSATGISRRCRLSISGTWHQRRMRPLACTNSLSGLENARSIQVSAIAA